jgi:hypothetical protein
VKGQGIICIPHGGSTVNRLRHGSDAYRHFRKWGGSDRPAEPESKIVCSVHPLAAMDGWQDLTSCCQDFLLTTVNAVGFRKKV